jgi:hypothetical protein
MMPARRMARCDVSSNATVMDITVAGDAPGCPERK